MTNSSQFGWDFPSFSIESSTSWENPQSLGNRDGCSFYCQLVYIPHLGESEIAQSCPTLCDPMDCSLPVSSVYGIFQARILEWVAISFSRGSSRPKDRTWVYRIAGRRFNHQGSRTGHQQGPYFSPNHLTKCHTTNTSKVE